MLSVISKKRCRVVMLAVCVFGTLILLFYVGIWSNVVRYHSFLFPSFLSRQTHILPSLFNMSLAKCSDTVPEEYYQHTYCKYYEPVLSPTLICTANTKLVVGIISKSGNFKERAVFRRTILADIGTDSTISYFFLLAKTNNITLTATIAVEADKHNDIVVANFLDSYENLTLKSTFLVNFSSTVCPKALYTMKLDDDTYCDLKPMLQEIESYGHPAMKIYGSVFQGVVPIRNESHKWYIGPFHEKYLPRYVSGMAYIITQDLLPMLYVQAMAEPFIRIEDAFITGICVRDSKLPVNHINIAEFQYIPIRDFRDVDLDILLIIHELTPHEIEGVWMELHPYG